MDAAFAAYEGWKQADPATGVVGGVKGALGAVAWNVGTNKVMEVVGTRLQAVVAKISKPAASTSAVVERPENIEAFQSTEQRYQQALAAASSPQEAAAVKAQFATVQQRTEMKQKLANAVANAEAVAAAARQPDGTVDTSHPEYKRAMAQLNADTSAIHAEYSAPGKENRAQLHNEASEAAGLQPGDVIMSGGTPKNALSDMDVSAKTYAAGKAYAKALSDKGLKVAEFGDRWVVSNDTTIWKPTAGDAVGSSSYEAQVIFGASRGSDKFATQSGQAYTKGQKSAEQLGAVIDNYKKAGEAGLGASGKPDLHVIGKSADKAMDVVAMNSTPDLRNKLKALRGHQTPEQAGIVTLGASQDVKDRQLKGFLNSTQQAMSEAYRSAAKSSHAHEADLKGQLQQAVESGDGAAAAAVRRQLAVIRTDNRLAFATVSSYAPGLVTGLPPASSIPAPAGYVPKTRQMGWSPLLDQLNRERSTEGKATLSPPVPDAAPGGLAARCASAESQVDERLKTSKPGSDEAKYLTELKNVLREGRSTPSAAVQQTPLLTGYELSEVLRQLGVNPVKK